MLRANHQAALPYPALAAAGLLVLFLTGCGIPEGTVFDPLKSPPRWPDPPEPARIIYVGQLATSADLKPGRSGFQVLGDRLFGATANHAMLTPFTACSDDGNRVFVADSTAQVVHVFDLKTRRYEQWQPKGEGQHFSQPVGVAWDPAGRLIVSDSVGGVLWVFDTQGQLLRVLGADLLQRPCGIAIAPATHRIYVADALAHQVVVLSEQGQLLTRLGQRGDGLGEFNYPTSVALDSQGRLYVCDALNFRVQQFDAQLKPVRLIGGQGDQPDYAAQHWSARPDVLPRSKGDMPGYFAQPKAVAVDRDDHLYVVDAQFEAIQIFDARGRLLLTFGEEGHGPGQFWLPTGISIDRRNRVWTGDSYNRRVQVFEYLTEQEPWTTQPSTAPSSQP